MKLNSVSNVGFSGLWKATDVLKGKAYGTSVTGGRDLDNIYLQTQTYHPFEDEEITQDTKALEEVVGYNYYEYDSRDDNSLADSSIAVQQKKIGKSLDITKAQYDELIAIQKAGLEATEKLKALGAPEAYKMTLPISSKNDVVGGICTVEPETVNEILSNVEFVA
jgi:hypothetical protein